MWQPSAATTVCTVKDCGHNFSDAGTITYEQGPENDTIAIANRKGWWVVKAKGGSTSFVPGDPEAESNNDGVTYFGDFEDTIKAFNGWSKPQFKPPVDDLTPETTEGSEHD